MDTVVKTGSDLCKNKGILVYLDPVRSSTYWRQYLLCFSSFKDFLENVFFLKHPTIFTFLSYMSLCKCISIYDYNVFA